MWRPDRHWYRSVRPRTLAVLFVVGILVVSTGFAVVSTGQAPSGVDDGVTYTITTGGIYPHSSIIGDTSGHICAEKLSEDVNRVKIDDARLEDVDIYVGNDDSIQSHIQFDEAEVDRNLVLYTNGESALVDTLAELGNLGGGELCLPEGIPNPIPTTLEVYWLEVYNLDPVNLEISTSGSLPEELPDPTLDRVLNETNTTEDELVYENGTSVETTNQTTNQTANQTATPETTTGDASTTTPSTSTAQSSPSPSPTATVPSTASPTPVSAPTDSGSSPTPTATAAAPSSTTTAESTQQSALDERSDPTRTATVRPQPSATATATPTDDSSDDEGFLEGIVSSLFD